MGAYNAEDIERILEQVKTSPSDRIESETVEFKGYRDAQALHNSKDLAEEVSALANHEGGVIIVGVRSGSDVERDSWQDQLVGLDVDLLETQERLVGKIQPSIDIAVRAVSFEGKTFTVIEVPKTKHTLVSTRSGKTCIRDGRSSRPMQPMELEQAVKALRSYDWSAETLDVPPALALDPEAVQEALDDHAQRRSPSGSLPTSSYLEAIGVTSDGRVTRGGLLFLGRAEVIRSELGDLEYRFSWKKPNGNLVVNDIWSGNLWSTIKRALTHFAFCNSERTFRVADRQVKFPQLDHVAFHEGYLNALVHRDYGSDGMVAVSYTGRRLRITSPGLFYGGVTADNIAKHEPRHRNKALARILMSHHLVDRAGMGVGRMGIRSLMYGRGFPQFREAADSVEVSMEGEYLRAPITVLWLDHSDEWGITELLILNSVFETGHVSVQSLEASLSKLTDDPWADVQQALGNLSQVELCGTNDGVFVRVKAAWKTVLQVGRTFRVPSTSQKHMKLYGFLKRHGEASNADLTEQLGYKYSSQTSKFLRGAKYVARTGSGPSARWSLV